MAPLKSLFSPFTHIHSIRLIDIAHASGETCIIGMNLVTFPKRGLDILGSCDVINLSRDHSYNVQETIPRLCEHVIIDFDHA